MNDNNHNTKPDACLFQECHHIRSYLFLQTDMELVRADGYVRALQHLASAQPSTGHDRTPFFPSCFLLSLSCNRFAINAGSSQIDAAKGVEVA